MRADGSEAQLLVPGPYFLPEIAPDNLHVAFVANDPELQQAHLQVARLDSGEIVWRTSVPFTGFQPQISPSRSRWYPDGTMIYFIVPLGRHHDGTGTPGLPARAEHRRHSRTRGSSGTEL
jgi:hypothetical protein